MVFFQNKRRFLPGHPLPMAETDLVCSSGECMIDSKASWGCDLTGMDSLNSVIVGCVAVDSVVAAAAAAAS